MAGAAVEHHVTAVGDDAAVLAFGGAISDGCNMVLDCGTCHPPEKCGAITPNVCDKP